RLMILPQLALWTASTSARPRCAPRAAKTHRLGAPSGAKCAAGERPAALYSASAPMRASRLGLFASDAAVIVGVEPLEHRRSHRRELGARDLAVIVGVMVRTLAALAPLAAFAPLPPLVLADDAVIVGVDALEHLRRPGEEFLARDLAVIVGVGAGQHVHAAAMAAMLAALHALGAHFFARQL